MDPRQPDTHDSPPSHAMMEQAAQWYALLISGDASASDRAEWEAWLSEHPQHRHAWTYVEFVSQRVLAPLQTAPDPSLLATKVQDIHARGQSRRRALMGLGILAGVGALGWTGWTQTPLPTMLAAWRADYRTGIGEIREFELTDGSHFWLNASSAINADLRADLRKLTLVAGEVLISTAHGDPRPFIVETPQGRLRALGTRFTVRREVDRTFLAVYQGTVEIRTAGNGTRRVIQSGEQTTFDPQRIHDITPADPAREAWSRGELIAWNLSLADVVAELNHYYVGHIALAPAVAQRRVFGTFPLRDVRGALAMLADASSLRIRQPLPWWISIDAADTVTPPAAH